MTCSTYFKDYVAPSLGPLISLFGVVIFLWVLPKRQARRKLALELWQAFNSDEMQIARRAGWRYLHSKSEGSKDPKEKVWTWAFNAATLSDLLDEEVSKLQQTLRVFEFFAACDTALKEEQVDRQMLRSLLGHAFLRWHAESINLVVAHVFDGKDNLAQRKPKPQWVEGMTKFQRLMQE